MCSVNGKPILEPYLAVADSDLVGPLTHDECESHFSTTSTDRPAIEGDFHFYHPDLGPTNIMMSTEGKVVGVLDWEAAGYYPKFWIATKPSVSPGLDFDPPPPEYPQTEWRKSLKLELERLGYPSYGMWFMKWRIPQ